MSKKIIIKLANNERYYTKCYHDFMDCNLLNGEEKIIFLALKRFLNVKSDDGDVFPTIETIQKITGWGNQKVVKYIKNLEQKGVVKKVRKGLNKPNIYILSDYPEMWNCESIEDMIAVADNKGVKPLTAADCIAELERMGYKVEVKEKELEKAAPAKVTADSSTLINNFSTDKGNTNETESQVDRYTMEAIKEMYRYEDIIIQYPDKQTDIDIVFDILYDTLNSTKPTVRINGQEKQTMVVIGKLKKLEPDDLVYAVTKFHEQTDRIKNVKAYLLTVLYHAKDQYHLDLMNLGHYNGDF